MTQSDMAETLEDKERQRFLEEWASSCKKGYEFWGFSAPYSRLDGSIHDSDGNLVGLYEVRHRNFSEGEFNLNYDRTALLNISKWEAMKAGNEVTGLPVYLLFGTTDSIYLKRMFDGNTGKCAVAQLGWRGNARSLDKMVMEIQLTESERIG